jgi:guanylate kinase
LIGRGTETPKAVAVRLENAKKELEEMPGFFNYECYNIDVDECAKGIICELEKNEILKLKEGETPYLERFNNEV